MASKEYQQALQAFQQGQLHEAQSLLQKVSLDKSDFDAWHLRGAIHASLGEIEPARDCLAKAMAKKPRDYQVRFNLAKLEKLAGRLEQAEKLYLELHAEQQLDIAVTNELAVLAFLRNDFTTAQLYCHRALAVRPDDNRAAINQAAVKTCQGDFDAALESLNAAADQTDPVLLLQRASVIYKAGQSDLAIPAFELLAQSPRFGELEASDVAMFHANFGGALVELDRYDEAEAHYASSQDAVQDGWLSLINIAQYNEKIKHDYPKARKLYEEALKLYPEVPDVHDRYANFLHDMGEIPLALTHHQKALAIRPLDPEFQFDASKTELALGMLEAGWLHYDARWVRTGASKKPEFPWTEWQGEEGDGKSILVYREQGLGDEIFFATCLPDLAARFSQVVYACHPKLATLFSRTYPEVIVVPNRVPRHELVLEQFDYQVAVGSLPRWLRPTIESFPASPRLMQDDVTRTGHWQQRFAGMGNGLKVGIAWRSGFQNQVRGQHYLSVAALAPLLRVPGVNFINMQYHLTQEEQEILNGEFAGKMSYLREVDMFDDLDALASVIKACDLIIAPSTSLYQMSGALGVPTLLLSGVPYGYFQLGTDASPWFPSATHLAKQPDASWAAEVEQAAYIVAQLAHEKM